MIRSLLVCVIALTACSSTTVIESLGPSGTTVQDQTPAEATTSEPVPVTPDEPEISLELAVLQAIAATAAVPDQDEAADGHWCSGPAERMRLAFSATIWADRPGGSTLQEALTSLLQIMIELRPVAPDELQPTFTDAITSQVEVNAALDAVAWDRSNIDWSTVDGIDLNEESTIAIDQYGARICGLRPGFLLPEDGAPPTPAANDVFEDMVTELERVHGLHRNDARCLVEIAFEYDADPSDEISEQISGCGISQAKLAAIASS